MNGQTVICAEGHRENCFECVYMMNAVVVTRVFPMCWHCSVRVTANWRVRCHDGPAIRRTWVNFYYGWIGLRKHWAAQTDSSLRWETRPLTSERPRYSFLWIITRHKKFSPSVLNVYIWVCLHFSFSMKKCWITAALWRPSLRRGQIWQNPTPPSRRCSNYSADTIPSKIRPRLIPISYCPLLLLHCTFTYPVFW